MIGLTATRWTHIVTAAMLSALLVGACSGSATPAPTAAPSNAAPSVAAPSAAAPSAAAPSVAAKTVGIVDISATNITAHSFVTEAQKAFAAKNWKVLQSDSNGDQNQANTLCTQYVSRKVDVIVVNIYTCDAMAACLAAAKGANIPVFLLGSNVGGGAAGAIPTVLPGPMNDRFLSDVSAMGGDVQVFALTFKPGAPCLVREQDLDKKLPTYPKLKVTKYEVSVPGQVTIAQNAANAWLQAHPASKGEKLAIWACWSDPAIGALSAVKQQARTNIPIWTWDFTKQTVDPIKAGEIAATLWVDPSAMAQQLLSLIDGYFQDPTGWQPKELEAGSKIIDKSTIDAFVAANPNAAQ
jgi:ribose transport system substrate-binding protein